MIDKFATIIAGGNKSVVRKEVIICIMDLVDFMDLTVPICC